MTDSLTMTPSVVALGMFDGMHLGHRALIERCVSLAREWGIQSVVYSFLNHPRSVFGIAPEPLMSAEERAAIMKSLGVDRVDLVPFTREMAACPPKDFILDVVRRYAVRAVVAGEDYTFGYKGSGTVRELFAYGREMGFRVEIVPFVTRYGEKVSSTRIREAIQRGDRTLARELLGEPLK